VLEQRGPAALSHRLVAERAGVPLGSTTYHFAGRQDLLGAALEEVIADHRRHIGEWATDLDLDNWVEKVADLLLEQSAPGAARRRLLVEHELYIHTARSQELQPQSRRWDSVLRGALTELLGHEAGSAVFSVYNGLALGSLVTDEPLDKSEIVRLLAIVGSGSAGR